MAAWGYTRGEPWIETLAQDEGERSRHVHYLFPDGRRRRVTIDTAVDSAEVRDKIGEALAAGRVSRVKKGRA